MPQNHIRAILVTNGHLFQCFVLGDGQRMLDILNAPGTDFLKVEDVHVYRHSSDECLRTYSNAVIRKSSITLAILTSAKHEAPEKRQNSYSAKDQYEAFIAISDYEINGKMHLKGSSDAMAFLNREAKNFVPITQATIQFNSGSNSHSQQPVVIANKSAIDLLQLIRQVNDEESLLNSIRSLLDEKADSHDIRNVAGESVI